ncbi:MAG: MotA/TolQ/ExbB proton channel family protein [Pseudomonadales bacterium]
MSSRIDTSLIYRALILTGLVLFGFYLAADRGLVTLALNSDRSYISWVILGVYALASFHWLWSALYLTRERRRFSDLEDARLQCDRTVTVEDGLLGEFFVRLDAKSDDNPAALLSAFGDELANRHAIGHFVSDVLLKLGLLGTVVGFILMLLPVGEIEDFDPSMMQRLLSAMSGGMAVALYTTIAGLVTSTLLKLQYHVVDTSAADLVTRLQVFVDTQPQEHRDGARGVNADAS